ncbi:hypothetical protein EV182_003539 [Spiromyces aspiralis]|uniref:Uncharacterized protein n=1 Tax=Spiromyces aspiralis TaxID=68401 RepID=A0ACC1HSQ1_9FUNG|nr:hypothetical protein EV182_003539 [Spiromyces aspiralis]
MAMASGFSSFAKDGNVASFASLAGRNDPSIFDKKEDADADQAETAGSKTEVEGGGKSGVGDQSEEEPDVKPTLTLVGTGNLQTFEEDEDNIFSGKAKLYELGEDNRWIDRGAGLVRINVERTSPYASRIIMRANLTYRLMMNSRLFDEIKAGVDNKFLRFGIIDPETKKITSYLFRFATPEKALEAREAITTALDAKRNKE